MEVNEISKVFCKVRMESKCDLSKERQEKKKGKKGNQKKKENKNYIYTGYIFKDEIEIGEPKKKKTREGTNKLNNKKQTNTK